jgi:formate hydrogenlyase subunit 3/multisubunit Na+/H+ antiporter MnhD subunit
MMSPSLFSEPWQIALLSLVPGLPLLVAGLMVVKPWQGVGVRLAPWSALAALGAALFLQPGINLEVTWFFMGGRMGIDFLGQRFLLLAALVWMIAAFYGRVYLRADPRRRWFFFFFLVSMAFNFGLILAQDMLGFYLFFGLMSFSAYGLIVHTGSREARLAGKVYIILVMVGEVLLFSGMALLAGRLPDLELATIAAAGPDNLVLVLLFVGFAIKAGALPLHVWLPLAHPVAPAPASAVLSGVMIKAGLLGWLRFLPMGPEMARTDWGAFFVVMGVAATFYGVALGLLQRQAKTILAYSSISQMGVMTMVVGCGLLAPEQWPRVVDGVSLFALHHGLAKAALFLGLGLLTRAGVGRQRGLLLGLLLLPSLALAGLPLTSGALAKFAVKEMIHGLPAPWAGGLGLFMGLSALATVLLLGHFLKKAAGERAGGQPLTAGLLLPWFALLAAVAGLLWCWPQPPAYAGHLAEWAVYWQGVWPVLGGAMLLLVVWKGWPQATGLSVPAGDILWLVAGRGRGVSLAGGGLVRPWASARLAAAQARWGALLPEAGRALEKRFMRWAVVGGCYLVLCLGLVLLWWRGW